MEQFWQFMNSTGFLLTAFGTLVGFFSWHKSKTTDKMINEGHSRLEEGNMRLEKSISEGNMRLEKIISDGNKRLEKSISEGNMRLEKSISEGNMRLENSLDESRRMMSMMQSRWDMQDELNKRLLDKILEKVA